MESNVRKTLFAFFAAVMLAGLGGCAVVPAYGGYGYDYVEPRVSVVVPFGYYGGGHRHYQRDRHYRGGPRGRW